MLERILVWGAVVLVLTAGCVWKPRPMRTVIGVFFVLMGLGVHGAFVIGNPQGYVDFASGSPVPVYREIAVAIVSVSPRGFGVLMMIFELALACCILSKGRFVKLGLLAGVAFLVGITPLGLDVLPNAILAGGVALLLRQDYPLSPLGELRQWRAERKGSHLVAPG